jgi:hypothetical protein
LQLQLAVRTSCACLLSIVDMARRSVRHWLHSPGRGSQGYRRMGLMPMWRWMEARKGPNY